MNDITFFKAFNPPTTNRRIVRKINNIISSGQFICGKHVKFFETAFAKYHQVKYCTALNSGTAALHLALLALNIGHPDEVILPSHTFFATAEAISLVGAKPVFADIDSKTMTIDPQDVESKINSHTKAIIPVHLYGQLAAIKKLKKVANKHGLFLIEDAAQAHGARLNQQKAGTFGQIGCFSFYPTKNLGAFGEAGATITNSKKLDQKIKMLRDHGQEKKYFHRFIGLNYRLNEIQAVVLKEKLFLLDLWVKKRQQIASWYQADLNHLDHIILPQSKKPQHHAYHLFVIRVKNRNQLQNYLSRKNISTMIHYPIPIHHQPPYKKIYSKLKLPHTDTVVSQILSLPLYPQLKRHQVFKITNTIKSFYT